MNFVYIDSYEMHNPLHSEEVYLNTSTCAYTNAEGRSLEYQYLHQSTR